MERTDKNYYSFFSDCTGRWGEGIHNIIPAVISYLKRQSFILSENNLRTHLHITHFRHMFEHVCQKFEKVMRIEMSVITSDFLTFFFLPLLKEKGLRL